MSILSGPGFWSAVDLGKLRYAKASIYGQPLNLAGTKYSSPILGQYRRTKGRSCLQALDSCHIDKM